MQEVYFKQLNIRLDLRRKRRSVAFVVSALVFFGGVAAAKPFTVNRDYLQSDLEIPVAIKPRDVLPKKSQIEKRVRAAERDVRVEPIYLQVPVDDDARAAFTLAIARSRKYRALMSELDRAVMRFRQKSDSRQRNDDGNNDRNDSVNPLGSEDLPETIKLRIRPEVYKLIRPKAIAEQLKRRHLRVMVRAEELRSQPGVANDFLTSLNPFFEPTALKKIQEKIRAGIAISVDDDLLPGNAPQKVRRFEIFRGPNCFMTALGFQYPRMIGSDEVNIRVETNHHEAMINNDELWRVLQSSFYEVEPARSKLKYGDMLVFFALPSVKDGGQQPDSRAISFRWIKHATTFLFNDLVYSKGSKSPNSPYVVGTLRDEWQAWSRHIEKNGGKLGVKVFRKPLKSATTRPPKSLEDWMY